MAVHAASTAADATVDAIHALLTGPADRAARWLAAAARRGHAEAQTLYGQWLLCLLYTSDAADEHRDV